MHNPFVNDIDSLIDEATKEVNKEVSEENKKRVKASLRRIKDAERILQNAKIEYAALIRDLKAGTVTED